MTTRNLDALFAPAAIAMIGANRKPRSVGAVVTRNLMQAGFSGPIRLVNPHGGEIEGQPVYSSLDLLPETPDLAVIATPAETVPGVIADLGMHGCRAAVVISAGFEGGGRAANLKKTLLEAARPHLLRIVGPNCLGVLSPATRVNASFASGMPPAGQVALVAQSGAIAAAAMDSAAELGLGFSHVVTVGDCADVDVGDVLDWLALDRATHAVLLYLEGVGDARKFMSAARAAARVKPVAALKAGRSASGAKAALSHTGALAGTFAVYEAAFRRAGLLQVENLGDLLQAGAAFAAGLSAAGDRLAILTNGGGAGVLAVDALDLLGERACELSAETLAALERIAPANWSRRNPVDILGDAQPETYGQAMTVLLQAPEVDAVMVLSCPTAAADSTSAAGSVTAALKASPYSPVKPVIGAWLGGETMEPGRRMLDEASLPAYATPEDAARAYAHLARARRNRELLWHVPPAAQIACDVASARVIVEEALADRRTVLTDPEARAVLRAYCVPVVDSREVRTPEEAGVTAQALGGPIALKILSRQISHKTDVGGVTLDLAEADETIAAARRMLAGVAAKVPGAVIEGFVVEPMLRRPEAQEMLVGVVQDPTFGPVVVVGHGGVAVEVLADRALGLPPLNEDLAREMITSTRVSRLLTGFRGRRPADLGALSRVLVSLGRLSTDLPEIAELDINPLLCDADGVLALDARIRLQPLDVSRPRPAILPYPADLGHQVTLGAERLNIRPIRPEDASALNAMVEACSQQDLRLRFGSTFRRLWPELTALLTQIDYDRQMTLVAEDQTGAFLGVAQLYSDPEGETAEFALMVRSDHQGRGLGGLLLQALLAYARARGLATVWGATRRDNAEMIELARELGFQVRAGDDPAELRLTRPVASSPQQ
jgi:acetyltransferase